MDKLLSEEEIFHVLSSIAMLSAEEIKNVYELIQSQKIAHADMVIGTDTKMIKLDKLNLDETRNANGHNTTAFVMNKLRIEQRERNQ